MKDKYNISLCTVKRYKVKNLIESSSFKLHNIDRRRGVLRTESKIQDGDLCKNR